jgi:hypothetical protein
VWHFLLRHLGIYFSLKSCLTLEFGSHEHILKSRAFSWSSASFSCALGFLHCAQIYRCLHSQETIEDVKDAKMPVQINQPSNQIKLTNVSLVRMKKGIMPKNENQNHPGT